MKEILQYLKRYGERLDADIAEATGYSLPSVRLHLAELAAKGDVMTCHLTRFENGCKVEGMVCRISGYIPKTSPGRKSKTQLKSSQ